VYGGNFINSDKNSPWFPELIINLCLPLPEFILTIYSRENDSEGFSLRGVEVMVNIIKTFRPVYCLFHKPSQVVRVWCLLISGLFYLTAAINTASAATYYIDPVNGNDTDPGTSAEPWKTATKGFQVSTYGDTVMLRNGNYGDVYNPISFPVYTDSMTEPLPPSTEFITFKADVGCEPVFTRVYLGAVSYTHLTLPTSDLV